MLDGQGDSLVGALEVAGAPQVDGDLAVGARDQEFRMSSSRRIMDGLAPAADIAEQIRK